MVQERQRSLRKIRSMEGNVNLVWFYLETASSESA
jgi:hypothetical protein